jgi:hypothetical protein
MHPYLRMVIQTFRISTGELKTSDYSKWADDPKAEHLTFSTPNRIIVVTFVWAFWLMNIYLILIVMLNLLIA